jgi:hypothetical protein
MSGTMDGFTVGATEVVDIASTDYTFTSPSICALYVSVGGTLVAKLAEDATSRTWGTVAAGSYIYGTFSKIIKSGTSATVIGLIPNGMGATGL